VDEDKDDQEDLSAINAQCREDKLIEEEVEAVIEVDIILRTESNHSNDPKQTITTVKEADPLEAYTILL